MKRLPVVHHPAYQAPLAEGHRFPMRKYGLLAEVLASNGTVPHGFIEPEPAPQDLITLAHDPTYVAQVFDCRVRRDVERRIGLPVDEGLVRRARFATAGTLLAARLALEHGLAGNTAGGSHHAQVSGGAGFCIFNDVAIAALALKRENLIRRALVIDLDVHQGDGTADCLAGEPDLFTFSMHAENNYPTRKVSGDLDIGLPDAVEDADYLRVLEERVPGLLDRLAPDLVFYNAGVDPHVEDRLGRLALTDAGLLERERFIVGEVRRRGIPLVAVIGGGYMTDAKRLAERHAIVFETMADFVPA